MPHEQVPSHELSLTHQDEADLRWLETMQDAEEVVSAVAGGGKDRVELLYMNAAGDKLDTTQMALHPKDKADLRWLGRAHSDAEIHRKFGDGPGLVVQIGSKRH